MAKSFYSIIEEGVLEVAHRGEDVTLALPSWLSEASEHLDDEQSLLAWASSNGVLHGILHSGIQATIIAIRATARPTVKHSKDGGDTSDSIVTDKEGAQARVDGYKCEPVKRPGQGNSDKIAKALEEQRKKTRLAMEKVGVPAEQIEAILAGIK